MSSTSDPRTLLNAKVYIKPGNEVRRFQIDPQVHTFESFTNLLRASHETSPMQLLKKARLGESNTTSTADHCSFLVQYLDDESEWITVSSEAEWTTALRIATSAQATNLHDILRLKCLLIQAPSPIVSASTTRPNRQGVPLLNEQARAQDVRPQHRLLFNRPSYTNPNGGFNGIFHPYQQQQQSQPQSQVQGPQPRFQHRFNNNNNSCWGQTTGCPLIFGSPRNATQARNDCPLSALRPAFASVLKNIQTEQQQQQAHQRTTESRRSRDDNVFSFGGLLSNLIQAFEEAQQEYITAQKEQRQETPSKSEAPANGQGEQQKGEEEMVMRRIPINVPEASDSNVVVEQENQAVNQEQQAQEVRGEEVEDQQVVNEEVEDDGPIIIEQVLDDMERAQREQEVPLQQVIPEEPKASQPHNNEDNIVMNHPFEYPLELQSLVAMGFPNEELNKHLLREFKGDITRSVSKLLNF